MIRIKYNNVGECAFKVVKSYANVNHIDLHVGQKVSGGRETRSSRTSGEMTVLENMSLACTE